MFIKIHRSGNIRPVVAICDSDLIGKKFEEGKRQLDVRDSFYRGEEVNKERLIEIMKRQLVEDASFNIVGKESIQTAIECGIITKQGIAKLKDIPFALVLL